MTKAPDVKIDAVVIGRNEGARLVACLASLQGAVRRIVYVDSGSADGSVAAAVAAGCQVVELDLSQPFTAARARNAGLRLLAEDPPDYVQMVDGDCELRAGWLQAACDFLQGAPQAALVYGRQRERFPDATIYNRLCDWEWDVPVGQVASCAGCLMFRWSAVQGIGGYRADLIACEDFEICQRLISAGWQLWRIADEMTYHDIAMTRLGQWWRRTVRAGHGYAEVNRLRPGVFDASLRRVWVWGLLLPVVFVVCLWLWPPAAVVILGLYALSFLRVAMRFRRIGMTPRQAAGCAGLVTLAKFPNLQGVLTFHWRRYRGRKAQLIEYR